jgi:hypothetical protein
MLDIFDYLGKRDFRDLGGYIKSRLQLLQSFK